MSQIYIIVAAGALAVIAGLLILAKKVRPESKLSPLAGLAFGFILAGICLGESRLIGYGLMGVGVLIAFIDIAKKLKK